jgi:uncharacterized protein
LRIVLDTNVLIAALIFPGVSSEVFDSIVQNHEIVLSEWIVKEFISKCKCKDKFKIPPEALAEILTHLKEQVTIASPQGKIPEICRDADDNNVLWIAETVKAELIVTGDQELLVLKEFNNIRILSPRDYKADYMSL